LDLSELNLIGIPAEVFELTGLRKLDLNRNQLTELLREIAGLKNLKDLNLTTPGIKPDETDLDLEERSHDQAYMASGPELRLLREILGKKDTGSHWGGLDRVVTPGGHILWLCKDHAKEYR